MREGMVSKACARGKVEAVRAWATGEQSSCSDVKQWALEYFGQRKHDTVNDDGTTNSVAQKYLDQQSVLLTWNGPWGEFGQDPFLLEVWPFFSGCLQCRGARCASTQHRCFLKTSSRSRPWARSPSLLRRHPRINIMLQLIETALVDWQGLFQIRQYAW